MKHYLLTWYGITDLNAALGFEDAGGPILGALRNGEYTDALVLAYTNPTKDADGTSVSRQELAKALPLNQSQIKSMPRAQAMEFTDAFANTSDGHHLYKKWLENKLAGLGLKVNVRMCFKELEQLNDAKGIYAAAIRALEILYSDIDSKDVTLYLSPGTPVMAFTWAFVSMVNPELRMRVIACPDFRKPPEEIRLPYELLAPSSRKPKRVAETDRKDFDVVFHLFGEQRLPGVLGLAQFDCKRHVFITSERYPAGIMRNLMPADPFVYHHKWLFVADDYGGFDVQASKERSLAWLVLSDVDSQRIGKKSYWEEYVIPRIKPVQ